MTECRQAYKRSHGSGDSVIVYFRLERSFCVLGLDLHGFCRDWGDCRFGDLNLLGLGGSWGK